MLITTLTLLAHIHKIVWFRNEPQSRDVCDAKQGWEPLGTHTHVRTCNLTWVEQVDFTQIINPLLKKSLLLSCHPFGHPFLPSHCSGGSSWAARNRRTPTGQHVGCSTAALETSSHGRKKYEEGIMMGFADVPSTWCML